MKKFENPNMEIERFDMVDIVATSCLDDCPDFEECRREI